MFGKRLLVQDVDCKLTQVDEPDKRFSIALNKLVYQGLQQRIFETLSVLDMDQSKQELK